MTSHMFYNVAPVNFDGDAYLADVDETKIAVRVSDAIDRMPGGLRGGEVFAVWEHEDERPNPREALEHALAVTPDLLLVHIGGGELRRLHPEDRLLVKAISQACSPLNN